MAEGGGGEKAAAGAMAEEGGESVKLFVGQVPKHMTEAQLLAMFKEFALVDEVNIIKDKATKASRGLSSQIFLSLTLVFVADLENADGCWLLV